MSDRKVALVFSNLSIGLPRTDRMCKGAPSAFECLHGKGDISCLMTQYVRPLCITWCHVLVLLPLLLLLNVNSQVPEACLRTATQPVRNPVTTFLRHSSNGIAQHVTETRKSGTFPAVEHCYVSAHVVASGELCDRLEEREKD